MDYETTVAQIVPGSIWRDDRETLMVHGFDGRYADATAIAGPRVGKIYARGPVNWDHFGRTLRRIG